MNLPIKHINTFDDKPSELTNPKVIDFLTRLYLKVPALSFEVTRTRSDQEATKFMTSVGWTLRTHDRRTAAIPLR